MGTAKEMMLISAILIAAIHGQVMSGVQAAGVASRPSSQIVVAPAPLGEELSNDYSVMVNGQAVPVYRCRVSAVPLNQVWPGYQRPLDQTELASFAYWDMNGPVQVAIVARQMTKTVAIHPGRLGIKPTIADQRISFTLDKPTHFTIEIDGTHHALHLFASPLEKTPPQPGDPGVQYFGPGIHEPGRIELRDNQTVYVAAGAVVRGYIAAKDVRNIRILGRGILDASSFERGTFHGIISLAGCRNAVVDGIILRDPPSWTVIPAGSRNVRLNNLKLIGLWRYNSDGIDVVNSQDVTITNCFVRSFDDSIIIKGLKWYDQLPVRNVTVSKCVVWNDWGKALAIGPETCAPEISNIVFEECDIIRTNSSAMDIHGGDRAKINNVVFESIHFEVDEHPLRPRLQTRRDESYEPDIKDRFCPWLWMVDIRKTVYSKDEVLGSIDRVRFKNINVTGPCMPSSHIGRPEVPHEVTHVTVEGLQHNGQFIQK